MAHVVLFDSTSSYADEFFMQIPKRDGLLMSLAVLKLGQSKGTNLASDNLKLIDLIAVYASF